MVAFTVLLRIIMSPLDIVSRKALQKQTAAQPYVARIQKKYVSSPRSCRKNRRVQPQTRHQHAQGCLPLLLTLPLFIIFLDAMTTWGNVSTCNIYLQAEVGLRHFRQFLAVDQQHLVPRLRSLADVIP